MAAKTTTAEEAKTLYAHTTVELIDLVPGEPPLVPVTDGQGRNRMIIYRRGDVIPMHLFATYLPSPGMPVSHSDLDSLLEYGAVGWDEPGPEPPPNPFYVIRTPDGQEITVHGEPPNPGSLQVVSGETIRQDAGASVKEV